MKKRPLFPVYLLTFVFCPVLSLIGDVGGVSGSNQFSVTNSGTTKYKIVSASVTGSSVYTATIDSVSGSDSNITFATSLDESNTTVNPFVSGAFNKDAQVPVITATLSGSTVGSTSVSYGASGYQSTWSGFTNAPQVIFSPSGDTTAVGTATISSGEITGITITDAGTGYNDAPTVSVVGGPHFVRIIDESSNNYGNCFLINNNSETSLDLELGGLNASSYFSAGDLVEVVPAATLASVFGAFSPLSGWNSDTSYRSPTNADWVYLWDPNFGYRRYSHVSGHHRTPTGWYAGSKTSQNNAVIYPDQAFIIAKRISGTVTFDIAVSEADAPARVYLPATGDLFVANNPYGMKMLLAELIPSTSIGDGTGKFISGTDNTDADMDTITILDDSGWTTYYYKDGVNSTGITELMSVGAKSGTGGSNALTTSDLFIGSGTITAVETCTSAAGANPTTQGNDGNWTKLTLSSTTPGTGFKITLTDIQGYMLSDDGTSEVNATTGESVETNGTGSIVFSNLIGTHEVVGSGSGYVVIHKQRDINFKSDEGSPAWNVGDLGTGYSSDADAQSWYAIGGGGSGASGTVSNSGDFTVTAGGSGYSSAPQIVTSGGGWRVFTDANAPKGGVEIGAEDGIIIHRKHASGVEAEIVLSSISD